MIGVWPILTNTPIGILTNATMKTQTDILKATPSNYMGVDPNSFARKWLLGLVPSDFVHKPCPKSPQVGVKKTIPSHGWFMTLF